MFGQGEADVDIEKVGEKWGGKGKTNILSPPGMQFAAQRCFLHKNCGQDCSWVKKVKYTQLTARVVASANWHTDAQTYTPIKSTINSN